MLWIYFDSQGVAKCKVNVGNKIRQGDEVPLFVYLEGKNEGKNHWRVTNVAFIRPNSGTLETAQAGTSSGLTEKTFSLGNPSEANFYFKNGETYKGYYTILPSDATSFDGNGGHIAIKITLSLDADQERMETISQYVEPTYGNKATHMTDKEYGELLDLYNNYNAIIEKGEGISAGKQVGTPDTIDFTGKNPNATSLSGGSLTGTLDAGGQGEHSMSLGGKSIAMGKRSLAEGTTTIAKGNYSHAEGCNSVSIGNDSHSEGYSSTAAGTASHAEGYNTQCEGHSAHSEGIDTSAEGDYSHAEGHKTLAYGEISHAEGAGTSASGYISHTEGDSTAVFTALPSSPSSSGSSGGSSGNPDDSSWDIDEHRGTAGHAEGVGSASYGYVSHTEGFKSVTYGHISHAEGEKTMTGTIEGNGGRAAHAEGKSTQAQGDASHAEGESTLAVGNQSHAGGFDTSAAGRCSFAHGNNASASADYSVAFGRDTKATSDSQAVFGINNAEDKNALFIVGNGQDGNEKNAFEVMYDGRAKVQTQPSESDDVVTLGYAKSHDGLGNDFVWKTAGDTSEVQVVESALYARWEKEGTGTSIFGLGGSGNITGFSMDPSNNPRGSITFKVKEYKFMGSESLPIFSADSNTTKVASPMGSSSFSLANGEATITANSTKIELPDTGSTFAVGDHFSVGKYTTDVMTLRAMHIFVNGRIDLGEQSALYHKAPEFNDEVTNKSYVDAQISNEASDRTKAIDSAVEAEKGGREAADAVLQDAIDAINASQNFIATYKDESKMPSDGGKALEGDCVLVLTSTNKEYLNQSVVYEWTNNAWSLIGPLGDYYTKGEIDKMHSNYYTKSEMDAKMDTYVKRVVFRQW